MRCWVSLANFEPLEVPRAKHAILGRSGDAGLGCSSITFAWYCGTVHFTVLVSLLDEKIPILYLLFLNDKKCLPSFPSAM